MFAALQGLKIGEGVSVYRCQSSVWCVVCVCIHVCIHTHVLHSRMHMCVHTHTAMPYMCTHLYDHICHLWEHTACAGWVWRGQRGTLISDDCMYNKWPSASRWSKQHPSWLFRSGRSVWSSVSHVVSNLHSQLGLRRLPLRG